MLYLPGTDPPQLPQRLAAQPRCPCGFSALFSGTSLQLIWWMLKVYFCFSKNHKWLIFMVSSSRKFFLFWFFEWSSMCVWYLSTAGVPVCAPMCTIVGLFFSFSSFCKSIFQSSFHFSAEVKGTRSSHSLSVLFCWLLFMSSSCLVPAYFYLYQKLYLYNYFRDNLLPRGF